MAGRAAGTGQAAHLRERAEYAADQVGKKAAVLFAERHVFNEFVVQNQRRILCDQFSPAGNTVSGGLAALKSFIRRG